MASPTDQPGWLPDPERPGMVRWWNGLGWSDARRSADAAVEKVRGAAEDALRGSTITPQQVGRASAGRQPLKVAPVAAAAAAASVVNPFSAAAVALGAFGLVIGLYGAVSLVGLVVSLGGLLRSRRLARDGSTKTGFGQSLAGLVLSVVGLVRWIPVFTETIPDLLNS